MPVRIPATNELIPLLTALVGRDLTFSANSEPLPPMEFIDHLTLFVDDDDLPVMLAGGDAAFAYRSGAALAMVPGGRADEAIETGVADEDLLENYFEVMNVLTRVINDQGSDHVRLIPESSVDLDEMPDPEKGAAMDIEIEGYGIGKLNFWLF